MDMNFGNLDNLGSRIQQNVWQQVAPLQGLGDRIQAEVHENLKNMRNWQQALENQIKDSINAGYTRNPDGSYSVDVEQSNMSVTISRSDRPTFYSIQNVGDQIIVLQPNREQISVPNVNGFYDLEPYTGDSYSLRLKNFTGKLLLSG